MLILVRHGRTAANAAGLLQGRIDPPLDAVGEEQAERIAAALTGVRRVVSSPLQRARQTALRISSTIEIDDRWQEISYGIYEGRPQAEVPAAEWERWRNDPHHCVEGGESLAALAERTQAALLDLVRESQDHDVVVVSHVSPIKAAMAWALGVGVDISWRCQLDQAAITRIAVSARGASLRSFNDVAHLR